MLTITPLMQLGTDHLTCRGVGVMAFCFVQKFSFGQHELEYLFFLSRNIFPEYNIRLYDKNSESDYFFFLHQNQNIFFNNIGNQNIFFRITHNPPFKLNGRSLSNYTNSIQVLFLTLLCNDILSVWCSIKCTGSARGHTS